jgi:transposase InsO family protein
VWCVDFKGHFGLGDGDRCYPLTLTDGASRYLIKCEALAVPSEAPVRKHFELAFREFGLPTRIRSDNGAPFATKAIGGLSRLSAWWIQLGILPRAHRARAAAAKRPTRAHASHAQGANGLAAVRHPGRPTARLRPLSP